MRAKTTTIGKMKNKKIVIANAKTNKKCKLMVELRQSLIMHRVYNYKAIEYQFHCEFGYFFTSFLLSSSASS